MRRGDIFIDTKGNLGRVYFVVFGIVVYKKIGKWAELQNEWYKWD